MTEAQAAERGVYFPPPWVFSTRDIILYAIVAILSINALADFFFDINANPVQSETVPVVAAVSLTEVYQGAQVHFMDKGQSRERANLNVALLMPEIEASLIRLRASEQYSYIFTMNEAVPLGTVDVTGLILEDVLSAPQTLAEVVRSSHVQN